MKHSQAIRERVGQWFRKSGARVFYRLYNSFSVLFCLCLLAALLVVVCYLPPFGSPANPAHNEVPQRYIEQGVSEVGTVNVVTGMILDYRGFDTFGESCVLFVAVCAVLALLWKEKRDIFDELLHDMEETTQDLILRQVSRLVAPMIAVFGVYVVINGHLSPGGGFSGGAIIGSAMILFASSFGTNEAERVLSYDNCRRIITGALLFYTSVKGYSIYAGANGIPPRMSLGTPGAIFSAGMILPLNIVVALIVAFSLYILCILFSKGEMN